jgi:hypothetical protein
MNKVIPLILAAVSIFAVSSCSTKSSTSAQPMPGMSAQEHANMKKGGGSMSGMKM